jgi:hypothetical protein
MHARAIGDLHSEGPGNSTLTDLGYYSSYHTWNDPGTTSGGYWVAIALSGGDIDGPQTYGWCKKVGS